MVSREKEAQSSSTYTPTRSFSFGGRTQATQNRMQVEHGPDSPSQRIFLRLQRSHALDTDLLRGRQRWHDGEGASPTVARRSRGRAMVVLEPVPSSALPGSDWGGGELMGARIARRAF